MGSILGTFLKFSNYLHGNSKKSCCWDTDLNSRVICVSYSPYTYNLSIIYIIFLVQLNFDYSLSHGPGWNFQLTVLLCQLTKNFGFSDQGCSTQIYEGFLVCLFLWAPTHLISEPQVWVLIYILFTLNFSSCKGNHTPYIAFPRTRVSSMLTMLQL